MTGPGKPRSCSHPIYARTFTGVGQTVRMFSLMYLYLLEPIESDLLSQSTPVWNQMDIILFIKALKHKC